MSNFREYCKKRQLQEAWTGKLAGQVAVPLTLGAASMLGVDAAASGIGVDVDPNNYAGVMPGLFAGGVLSNLANLPKFFSDTEDKVIEYIKNIIRKPTKQEDPSYVKDVELRMNQKNASDYQQALVKLKNQSMFMHDILDKLEKIDKDPKVQDKEDRKNLLFRLGISREEYFHDKMVMDKFMSNLDQAINSGEKLSKEVPSFNNTIGNLKLIRSAINHRLTQLNTPKPDSEPEVDLANDYKPDKSYEEDPKILVFTNHNKGIPAEETINTLMKKYSMNRMSATNFYYNNIEEHNPVTQQYNATHFKPSENKQWNKIYKEGLVKAMARYHEPKDKIIGLVATRWNMKESHAKRFVNKILGSDYNF